tara:strand:+ start:423 stop:911 length:489 start_codon:yes stop_codon:yes gene_type:complete
MLSFFSTNAHEEVETMKMFSQSVSSNIAKFLSASALPSISLIVLLLATIITLPSDASAEIRKEYYPSGKLKSVGNYVDGEKEGIYKEYYENGQLWIEENYKNGKLHGLAKTYYESGQLWIEENYKNDKKNGVYSEYSKTGELRFRDIYKNDKKIKTKNIHNI